MGEGTVFHMCVSVHGRGEGYPSQDQDRVPPTLPLSPTRTRRGYPLHSTLPPSIPSVRTKTGYRHPGTAPFPLPRTSTGYPHPTLPLSHPPWPGPGQSTPAHPNSIPPGPGQGTPCPMPLARTRTRYLSQPRLPPGMICHKQNMVRAPRLLRFHAGGLSCCS